MMKVLHLSDTQLSGAPWRISDLLNKHGGVESKHYVRKTKFGYREFPIDLTPQTTTTEELRHLIYEWADVISYHNRWKRQEIFKDLGSLPPKKPSVIQIHSPRFGGEDFSEETKAGLPIAVVAQYQVRQWPDLTHIVPNVVDITDPMFKTERIPYFMSALPVVSFAPSSTNQRGWNDKGFLILNPKLKRMRMFGTVNYQLIQQKPFLEAMKMKRQADIGIDDIITGSYHLSALEYLSMGVPCLNHIDALTEKVIKDLTGCTSLPFIETVPNDFDNVLRKMIANQSWFPHGIQARQWMETYWNPKLLCDHYLKMYASL